MNEGIQTLKRSDQACQQVSSGDAPQVGGAQESTRTGNEAGVAVEPRAEEADEPMGTVAWKYFSSQVKLAKKPADSSKLLSKTS